MFYGQIECYAAPMFNLSFPSLPFLLFLFCSFRSVPSRHSLPSSSFHASLTSSFVMYFKKKEYPFRTQQERKDHCVFVCIVSGAHGVERRPHDPLVNGKSCAPCTSGSGNLRFWPKKALQIVDPKGAWVPSAAQPASAGPDSSLTVTAASVIQHHVCLL